MTSKEEVMYIQEESDVPAKGERLVTLKQNE